VNPKVFPVRGRSPSSPVSYVDSFGEAWGLNASHEGTDIFAERGSEVLAVEDGRAQAIAGERTGLGVRLDVDSGRYVYAHLDALEGEFPRAVKAGDLLGRVGSTGNAQGKSPHLHFEARGPDGLPVNPVPLLAGLRLPVAPLATVPRPRPPTVRMSEVSSGTLVVLALLYWLGGNRA
jgi:murein DD-endopeptidase MepM/ murein hydrolase activator NlpD